MEGREREGNGALKDEEEEKREMKGKREVERGGKGRCRQGGRVEGEREGGREKGREKEKGRGSWR